MSGAHEWNGGGGGFRGTGGSSEAAAEGWSGSGATFVGMHETGVAWDGTVTGLAAARLAEAVTGFRDALTELRRVPDLRMVPVPGIDILSLERCREDLDLAMLRIGSCIVSVDDFQQDIVLAGRVYEFASERVLEIVERAAGSAAFVVGAAIVQGAASVVATGIGVLLIGGLVALPIAVRLALLRPDGAAEAMRLAAEAGPAIAQAAAAIGTWLQDRSELLANPAVAAALALGIESVDELLAGAASGLLGVPGISSAPLEEVMGEDALQAGLAFAAAGALGAASGAATSRAGAMRSLPPLAAPITRPADAMRILAAQDEPITVLTFTLPDGSRRHQVLVDGTEDWGLTAPGSMDMLANVQNAGATTTRLSGSDAALREAMLAAGIRPGEPVDLFGYSQGGAMAANVAATGEFEIATALFVGAPVAGAELPSDLPHAWVVHEGDLVGALDGTNDGAGPVRVAPQTTRDLGTGAFARHDRAEYELTLEALAGRDFAYDAYLAELQQQTIGARGTAAVAVDVERR